MIRTRRSAAVALAKGVFNDPEPAADPALLQQYPIASFDDRAALENLLSYEAPRVNIIKRPKRREMLFAKAHGQEADNLPIDRPALRFSVPTDCSLSRRASHGRTAPVSC